MLEKPQTGKMTEGDGILTDTDVRKDLRDNIHNKRIIFPPFPPGFVNFF
jgi:hypothetical protein